MKNNDKEKLELYKQFILHMHGKQALDRLELEYAVQKTNDMLEYRDERQFEKSRNTVDE